MRIGFRSLLLILILFFVAKTSAASTPPEQPKSGPGGMDYRYAKVTKNVYGEGANQYWIFEPADPTPKSAPVIVFNHGWGATNPKVYGAEATLSSIRSIRSRGNGVTPQTKLPPMPSGP